MRIAIILILWLWSNILLNLASRMINSSTLLQRLNDTLSAFKIDLLISTFTFELTTHVVKSLGHVWRAQSRFMNHTKTRGLLVHIDIITVFKIAIWNVKSVYIVLCYFSMRMECILHKITFTLKVDSSSTYNSKPQSVYILSILLKILTASKCELLECQKLMLKSMFYKTRI